MPGIGTAFGKLRPYTWYVDSVNGNDANTGKTPSQAFRTIGKLLTVLQGNQRVRLARGSYWREEIYLTTQNSVTIRAYGNGAAPVLDCSDPVQAGWWSKTAGYTYVYQFSPTLASHSGGAGIWNRVWEDGTHLTRVTSLANCDATAGSYYASSDATLTPTIYVHASDNGNPASNGKTYEYANRDCGVNSYAVTGLVLDGVVCKRNLSDSGSIRVGQYSRILNCQANEGSKHNVYVRAGCFVANVKASKAYYNPSSPSKNYFVYNDDSPSGQDVTFIACTADNGGVLDPDATGFYGHRNVSGNFGNVLYQNCDVQDCGIGYNGLNATTITVRNCTTTKCKGFASLNQNMTVEGGSFYTAAGCQNVFGFVGAYTLTIQGGFIFGDDYDIATIANIWCNSAGATVNLNGVTFLRKAATNPIHVRFGVGGCTLNVQNCDFSGGNYVYYAPSGVTLSSDYNRFRDANSHFNIGGTTYNTVSDYKTGTGQDAHSTVG